MQKVTDRFMAAMVVAALVLGYGGVAEAGHRVMKMSKYSFDETVNKIKAAVEAEGMKVVSVIDHQAALKAAGMTRTGWVVIEVFSPKYTKDILEAEPSADLDIPLRISVMDGDPNDPHGKNPHASYYKPSATFGDYKKLGKVGKELDRILEKIVSTVAGGGH